MTVPAGDARGGVRALRQLFAVSTSLATIASMLCLFLYLVSQTDWAVEDAVSRR
jgi:hypothetical protein